MIFENIIFRNLKILDIANFKQIGKHRADNANDPPNTSLKVLNMRSISIKEYEIEMLGNLEYGTNIFQKT